MAGADNQKTADFTLTDPVKLAQNMAVFFERAAEVARYVAETPALVQKRNEDQLTPLEQVNQTLSHLMQSYVAEPPKLMALQSELWADYTKLWQNSWEKMVGGVTSPVASPAPQDRRFKDKDWQDNSVFDFVKQAYLITTRWALAAVDKADGLDEHTRMKARFYVEQMANAFSPSNFMFSNPEVLRATLASHGANLLKGLENFEEDLHNPARRWRLSQTDRRAFEVGRNIATTPGQVVFRNELFELIHYAPTRKKAYEIPLLIMPPWINKYYILDLNEQKSFVAWAVAQGLTVFVMSWVNADEKLARKSFSDYMREGFLTALQAVQDITQAPKVNVIGYCIGGTLLAASLGYMAAKGDERVNSATFLTTQVDFEKAGELMVFIDEAQIEWVERAMQQTGYLPGSQMANVFNLLRSNELIWSYVVNNYLLGKEPMAFDLLYWNSDSTRMPAGVHSFYLREFYLHNRLAKGQLVLDGVRIDLKKVTLPIYNLAARDDHIAPLASVFRMGKLMGSLPRLVVAGSGHIAGVINPPAAQKYQYWVNEHATAEMSLEEWLAGATEHPGSWWGDWEKWITARSGEKKPTLTPGSEQFPALMPAPGSYVLVRDEG